jgi:hypothetical protein
LEWMSCCCDRSWRTWTRWTAWRTWWRSASLLSTLSSPTPAR